MYRSPCFPKIIDFGLPKTFLRDGLADLRYKLLTASLSYMPCLFLFIFQSATGSVTAAALEAAGLPFDPTKV